MYRFFPTRDCCFLTRIIHEIHLWTHYAQIYTVKHKISIVRHLISSLLSWLATYSIQIDKNAKAFPGSWPCNCIRYTLKYHKDLSFSPWKWLVSATMKSCLSCCQIYPALSKYLPRLSSSKPQLLLSHQPRYQTSLLCQRLVGLVCWRAKHMHLPCEMTARKFWGEWPRPLVGLRAQKLVDSLTRTCREVYPNTKQRQVLWCRA